MSATASRPTDPGRATAPRAERFARPLLVAFLVAAAVDLAGLLAGLDAVHLVAKPLLMPLLAGYAFVRGGPRLLVAALLFGWAGTCSCSPTTTWPSSSAWAPSPSAMSAT